MGKLSLKELTSTKLSKSLVDTMSALKGGTSEYCHEGWGKEYPKGAIKDNTGSGSTSG